MKSGFAQRVDTALAKAEETGHLKIEIKPAEGQVGYADLIVNNQNVSQKKDGGFSRHTLKETQTVLIQALKAHHFETEQVSINIDSLKGKEIAQSLFEALKTDNNRVKTKFTNFAKKISKLVSSMFA